MKNDLTKTATLLKETNVSLNMGNLYGSDFDIYPQLIFLPEEIAFSPCGSQNVRISVDMCRIINPNVLDRIEDDGVVYFWEGMFFEDRELMFEGNLHRNHYFFKLFSGEIQKKLVNGKKLLKREQNDCLDIIDYFQSHYCKVIENLLGDTVRFLRGRYSSGLIGVLKNQTKSLDDELFANTRDLFTQRNGAKNAVHTFIHSHKNNLTKQFHLMGAHEVYEAILPALMRMDETAQACQNPRGTQYNKSSIADLFIALCRDYKHIADTVGRYVSKANNYDKHNDVRWNHEAICEMDRKKGMKSASEELNLLLGMNPHGTLEWREGFLREGNNSNSPINRVEDDGSRTSIVKVYNKRVRKS